MNPDLLYYKLVSVCIAMKNLVYVAFMSVLELLNGNIQ